MKSTAAKTEDDNTFFSPHPRSSGSRPLFG